uniref:Putative bilaris n=1 Tax=Rhipicephalus pulchellus TaxID=72859 RepID=L7LRM5_RHIPC
MDLILKAVSTLIAAGICIAWPPTAHDGRCSIYQPTKPATKCTAHRYQYNNRTNLCEPVCCSSAPFSSFLECSQTCRSIEVCFVHRPVASCGSGLVTVYYFNTRNGTCLKELGCSYKGNNFPSLDECQRTCRAKTNVPPPAVPCGQGCTLPIPSNTGAPPSFVQQNPQLPPSRPIVPPQSSQQWGGGMPSSNQHQGTQGQATSTGMLTPPPQKPWNPNTVTSSSHQQSQQPHQQSNVLFPSVSPQLQAPRAHDSRCDVSVPIQPASNCTGYNYQYDRRTHSCQPLWCSSAPFSTFTECSETCRSSEVCFMYRPPSSCKSKSVPVYYFNPLKDACFAELGCSYKGNNFPTLEECRSTCRAKRKGPSQVLPGLPDNALPSRPNNGGAASLPQQIPLLPARPVPPQQGGGRPPSNQQQGTQYQTTSGMIPSPGHRPWNHNNSAPGSHQLPGLSGSSVPSNPNNGGVSSFPQRIQQLPVSIAVPTQQSPGGPSSNHHQGNQRQTTAAMMPSPGPKPWNPNTLPRDSEQWPSLPGNSFHSRPNNEGASSFPQQIPQVPASTPASPQQGVGRPSSNHQQGNHTRTAPGMISSREQKPWNLNPPVPSSHQWPDLTGNSLPSPPNNGGSSSFPQQIPQLPVSIPVSLQQGGGGPSSTHQRGNQRQTTTGMMPLPGHQPWSPSQSDRSSHHRPGLPGNSFPSQQNTGGAPSFPPQIAQVAVSRPITPQGSGGMPISSHQQETPGQTTSGAYSWNHNSASSNSSHQTLQEPLHSQFPPAHPQLQGPGGGTQFPLQSQQQQWNGPESQQSSLHLSNHGTTQNMSPNQHGTRTLSTSTQRLGQEASLSHIGSPNSEQNAPHQWGNHALPPHSPQIPVQQSGSGRASPSEHPQRGNAAGTSSIPQHGQQRQWGSGNLPQNLQPYPSAQMPPAISQQGAASSWRSGAPAVGQQESTTAQEANGAGRVLPNPSTQPPWSSYAESVGSQGSQQGQSYSRRSGISPEVQQNTAAQHTGGAGLPIPIDPTQASLSGESRSQSRSTPVTSSGSQLNAQEQQHNAVRHFPSSFPAPNPNQLTQQSIHQRVVSVQQQTVHHSMHRQSVSASR